MTERLVKICRPSGTSAAPSLTISLRGTPSVERPQISMRPCVFGANAAIAERSELLPAPFGPIIATISPAPTSNVARLTARTES